MEEYEDITTTGGSDLKGIRNEDLYQSQKNADLQNLAKQIQQDTKDYASGRIGYRDTGASGWDKPVSMPELGDYGASKYDTDLLVNPQGYGNVIDTRAANQSAIAKWGASVPQAITTAGTTFLQGTVGLLYGAGAAVSSGEFNKLWNNDFTAAMDNVNKTIQAEIPIYQSQDEQANPLSNLFHAGPLAANLSQLTGFIAGAAYSGSAYMKVLSSLGKGVDALRAGKGAYKVINSLATASKNNMATQAAASILGANGEATIEAYGNSQDWAKTKKLQLEDLYETNALEFFTEASNQAAQEINPMDFPDRGSYLEAIKLRASELVQQGKLHREAEIDNASIKMGNVIWAENMALLGFTNYKTLGRIYSGGYRANKTLANFVKKTTTETGETTLESIKKGGLRNALESVGKAAYEGVEEMSQSSFSKGAGYWTEKDIYEPLREKRNKKGEATTFDLITGLAEGVKDQLADPNNWVEFIMGMGAGMLPIPMPHRKANGKIGLLKTPEMINTFRENREMNQLAEETVSRINNIRSDPKYQTLTNALIVDAVKENKKQGSIEDQFAYKTEDYAQLVNLVTALERVDQVDLFSDQVQQVLDMEENNENGQVILEGLSKEGQVPEYLKNKTNQEIVQEYKSKAKQVQEEIQRITTNSENIRATYGDKLKEDALHSLVTLKSQLDNWNIRYKEVAQKMPDFIKSYNPETTNTNISTLFNSIRNNNTSLNFKDAELSKLYSEVESIVSAASKDQYIMEADQKTITDDLMDMYRMGMSLRNGVISFNSITFNPESFEQKVEKEKEKEDNKTKQEQVGELKKRYDKVKTIGDLNNLEASSSPEEFSALIKSLESSKDPKLKSLNQKRTLLGSISGNLQALDIPTEIKDTVSTVVENIINSTPVDALLREDSKVLFDAEVGVALNQLLASNTFGLTPEQLSALPDMLETIYSDSTEKIRKDNFKVPEVAPVFDDSDIIWDDGVAPESPKVDNQLEEDLKDSRALLSPSNPQSENPTVEPTKTLHQVEIDDSREKVGEISGGVSEVNFHALKYTGEIITPSNTDAWNEYARRNGLTQVDERFANIYNYLVDKGAYKYVNQGHLEVGDTVIALQDSSFGDTIFFGKPLKDISEIDTINDIQIVQAAPSSYTFGDKVIKSKDNSLTLNAKSLTVSQVFNGKYQYGEERALSTNVINSLFPEGINGNWTIGVISNNGQIYSKTPLTEDRISHDNPFTADHDGRIYLFVEGPNKKYLPVSLRTTTFTGELDGVIGDKIHKAVEIMSLASEESPGNGNHPQLNSGLEELSKYLYTGNLVAAITSFMAGSGVRTKHLALIKEGKGGEKDTKMYIPLQEASLMAPTRPREAIVEDIVRALSTLGLNYQVAKNSLRTDSKYQNFLVNSGVLTTNIMLHSIVDTNFTLVERNYESGRIIPTPVPAPSNPSPVTEAPIITPLVSKKEVPVAISSSKPFKMGTFSDILDKHPESVRKMFDSLEGRNIKIEKQLMLATALLSKPESLKEFGGLIPTVSSILSGKLEDLKNIFKIKGFNKKSISPENIVLYNTLRNSLMRDSLMENLYEADRERVIDNKDKTIQGVNKFQIDLENTNKLLNFAELNDSQKERFSSLGISEDEFNSWSRDQQDKIIDCYL